MYSHVLSSRLKTGKGLWQASVQLLYSRPAGLAWFTRLCTSGSSEEHPEISPNRPDNNGPCDHMGRSRDWPRLTVLSDLFPPHSRFPVSYSAVPNLSRPPLPFRIPLRKPGSIKLIFLFQKGPFGNWEAAVSEGNLSAAVFGCSLNRMLLSVRMARGSQVATPSRCSPGGLPLASCLADCFSCQEIMGGGF